MTPPADGQDDWELHRSCIAPEERARDPVPISRWIGGCLLLASVGYPASVGPAAWLDYHDAIPVSLHPAIETFYAPLQTLMETSETAGSVLENYVRLWLPDDR